jgi:tRNA-dihydrouridine synthase A
MALCEQGGAGEGRLDGFMLGRAAYHNPWILTEIDSRIYGEAAFSKSRTQIAENLIQYALSVQDTDRTTKALIRHVMGLYAGQAGARLWRRTLSEGAAD